MTTHAAEATSNGAFPRTVLVRADGSSANGLAVLLSFKMKAKNRFSYVAFFGYGGVVCVNGADLLRQFCEEASDSPMDYIDPRTGFTGDITASVMTNDELRSALNSYKVYHPYVAFPVGYEENLKSAIRRGPNPDDYWLELELQ